MSQFAQIDENNTVQRVLVIEQSEIDTGNWGDPASFIQTSYNTRGGVYYTPNTSDPDPDQSKAFRKNYAGIGYTWDGIGFIPPKPFPSWVMNSFSYQWEAPIPLPVPNSPPFYEWDEATLSWVEMSVDLTAPIDELLPITEL
jgi:hypothetical protein